MKCSPSIWRYVVNVKSTVKISPIFVAFSENMNFNTDLYLSYVFLGHSDTIQGGITVIWNNPKKCCFSHFILSNPVHSTTATPAYSANLMQYPQNYPSSTPATFYHVQSTTTTPPPQVKIVLKQKFLRKNWV